MKDAAELHQEIAKSFAGMTADRIAWALVDLVRGERSRERLETLELCAVMADKAHENGMKIRTLADSIRALKTVGR